MNSPSEQIDQICHTTLSVCACWTKRSSGKPHVVKSECGSLTDLLVSHAVSALIKFAFESDLVIFGWFTVCSLAASFIYRPFVSFLFPLESENTPNREKKKQNPFPSWLWWWTNRGSSGNDNTFSAYVLCIAMEHRSYVCSVVSSLPETKHNNCCLVSCILSHQYMKRLRCTLQLVSIFCHLSYSSS